MDLEVFVLGPLLVQRAGRPVELGPVRRRSTLAALLVDAGRTVPLDVLADRVWDGEPPESAVTALQAYVSRLRSALRQAADRPDAPDPIVTATPGYRFEVPAPQHDAARFEAALAAAHAAREAADHGEAAAQARAALALWRGEAYADVPTVSARREAERLAGLRRRAQEIAVESDLALGHHARVLDEAEAMVAATPLSEQAHAAFMLALHRSGRSAEAVDHYSRVQRLLADELGVDPGRELRTLFTRILQGDPSLDLVVAPAPTVPTAAAVPTVDVAADSPTMVGRRDERARLVAAIDTAAGGVSRAVAVVGEAGIGKSRLLEEGAAHARAGGAVVAWGRCWQHDGAPRLWPFVQVLRRLADEVGPDAFTAALGRDADAFAGLVPDLVASSAPRADLAPDLEGSELRVFDALAGLLDRLGRVRPVVVVLEDMHWADPASRRAIEYLVEQVRGPGVALLVSVRWPSDEATASTGALLAGLARGGRLERIDLTGFDLDDVRTYVADRTGSVIDDATSRALLERTDGNPFFVGEIVRLVVTDEGAGDPADARVPDSVRAVVLARMDRLAPDDRRVLDAAAVVGRSFDLDLLVAASDLPDDVVDEAVDRATAAGVLGTEPGTPGVHRFGHALVQQALLESLGPARRRRVHARAAAALATREAAPGIPRDPDQLVHHLVGAGDEADLARAVEISVARADAARASGDLATAEAVLLQAVDIASRLHGPDAPLVEMSARLRLYSLYALSVPSSALARAQRDRAVELARQYGRPADLLTALQSAYSTAIMCFELGSMVAIEDELAVAGEAMADDTLRLGALMCRTQRLLYVGRIADALVAAGDTIELLERTGVEVPTGAFPIHPARNARWFRAAALILLGRDAEAVAQARELDRLPVGRDPHTTTYINLLVSILQAARGDVDGAAAAVARTREAQQTAGIDDGALYVDVVEHWVAARRGGGDVDAIARLLAPFDPLPGMGMRPFLRGLHADALLQAGRPADAVVAVRAGLDEIDRHGERLSEAWLARLGGIAAEQMGDPVLGAAWRERAVRTAAELGIPHEARDDSWQFMGPPR